MFGIADRIAYAGRMVFATRTGPSPIRDVLGASAWIHVEAPSTGKWVEQEGRLITEAIRRVCAASPGVPDLYVICPFKVPADRLRRLLAGADGVLPGSSKTDKEEWIKKRVGTVHTFQGKEAEAVVLLLGGRTPGAIDWASETPNVLNVAVTRARRRLYVIGDRSAWSRAPRVAACMGENRLPTVSGADMQERLAAFTAQQDPSLFSPRVPRRPRRS